MERMRAHRRIPFLKPPPLLFLIISLLLLLTHQPCANQHLGPSGSNGNGGGGRSSSMVQQQKKKIKIGVVVDMGSWNGKNVHSCITMAISDFYASRHHYKTRLVLHTRDSGGDPNHALSSALDLLENMKVQALIIGPETVLATKSLGALGNKAKVPIFSFSSILSSQGSEYPFLVQINQDETFQFKGISSILSWYEWKTVSVIYEDTEGGKDSIPYLVGSLQERNIRVTYRTPISPFSTDDQILDELHKLAIVQQTIFIVHLSPSNSYRLFSVAKRLGMMKEGYAWIVTDKTMNQLQSMDWEVAQSMQGVVGLRAYIPSSSKLRDFSVRWKKEFNSKNPSAESRELDIQGIWAYDTIWALAESTETLGHEYMIRNEMGNFYIGKKLLDDIARTRFTGFSGEFQIVDGRLHSETFEIVNIIGKGERSVGFWTLNHGIVNGRSLSSSTSKRVGLDEAIIWPGITTTAPRGLLMRTSGRKLRIAVLNNAGFKQFVSVQRNTDTNTTSITGFCVDVFLAAIGSLDYQVPFEFIPYVEQDGKNLGSYSDLVYQLYLQNFDGIVGDVTITANRSLYADFTVTYTDLGIGTITKRENNDIWLFSRPLHPNLWLAIAAFLVLTGLVVWVIEHSSNPEFQGSVAYQIGIVLWFGFSTLFYAHRERLTSNLSRLVVIVWLFAVLVLTSTYTASLSSMLTLQKIQLGSAGEYIGTHLNSLVGGAIANNLNFKDDRLQLYSSPEEYANALSRGIREGGAAAIIDEIPYLKVFLAKYGTADYAMVASQSTTNGFGFAFQKNYAQLVSDLSQAIIKLREEGKLAAMENTWIKNKNGWSLMPENDATTPNILNLRSFGGLFLVSFLCCGLVLLICLYSILRKNLDYFHNVIFVLRDGGILTNILQNIAPTATGRQIQVH